MSYSVVQFLKQIRISTKNKFGFSKALYWEKSIPNSRQIGIKTIPVDYFIIMLYCSM